MLIDRGIIGLDHLESALRIQREQQQTGYVSSGDILIQLGYAKEEEVIEAFLMQYSVPYLPLDCYTINPHAIELIPHAMAKRLQIMPLDIMGNNLTVAVSNPLRGKPLDELQAHTGYHIQPCIATSLDIAKSIAIHYGIIEPFNWEENHVSGN